MSSEVIIKEVTSKAMLRKFVDVPNVMYKDVEQFVPAFYGDDLADWDPKQNPAAKYCESKAFLAYRDGEIVGRIAAILSKRSNELWKTNRMRFSQVDFIDDEEVSTKLFQAVEGWAKEKGCDQVHGPLGFCDMDREGMLVDGFDKRNMFITYYNYPYYNDHLARLGYEKDVDWIEFKVPVPSEDDVFYKRIHAVAQRLIRNGKYHRVVLKNRKEYKPYIKKVFNLVNECYSVLYSVVDLNQEQIEKYATKFIPLVNPEYLCLVEDENNELVAFGVAAPSVAAAIKKSNGRLFPFGWIGVLKALKKNDAIDLLLMGVKPDLQNVGVNALVLDYIMESSIKNGIVYAETGPQLETNTKMVSQWKLFNLEPHKRRRCYIKNILDIDTKKTPAYN